MYGQAVLWARDSGILIVNNANVYGKSQIAINSDANSILRLENCNITGKGMSGYIQEIQKTNEGYNVYFYGCSSSSYMKFPTWTHANGQDDIIWGEGTKSTRYDSTVWYYNVKKSDHNNESGLYVTHIYAEIDGVQTFVGAFDINV